MRSNVSWKSAFRADITLRFVVSGTYCQSAFDWGSDSYVERPGLQDLSLVEQGMTVRSYVRPVKRRLAAGHDDIRGSNRPINFSRSKRSESGGLIATGNDVIRGSSRFAPCLLGSVLLPPESS
jgi:hypothetical protein